MLDSFEQRTYSRSLFLDTSHRSYIPSDLPHVLPPLHFQDAIVHKILLPYPIQCNEKAKSIIFICSHLPSLKSTRSQSLHIDFSCALHALIFFAPFILLLSHHFVCPSSSYNSDLCYVEIRNWVVLSFILRRFGHRTVGCVYVKIAHVCHFRVSPWYARKLLFIYGIPLSTAPCM